MMNSWRRISSPLLHCQRRFLATDSSHSASPHTISRLLRNGNAGLDRQPIVVNGFVQSIRKQKKIVFVAVRDGSSVHTLQAVLRPDQGQHLSVGQAITLKGTLENCPKGAKQTHELHVTEATPLCGNDAESNPLQNKYQSPRYLRTIPHLRPRLPSQSLLLRLRSRITHLCSLHFASNGWVQTHPPLITSSDCEGAGEVFTVTTKSAPTTGISNSEQQNHFRTPKYLTVSAQLHLEALAAAVEKVWCLAPTFRAEKSDTARHLSEFYMLEAEMSFTKDINDVMDVLEHLVRYVTHQTIFSNDNGHNIADELLHCVKSFQPVEEEAVEGTPLNEAALERRWAGLVRNQPWARVSYDSAFDVLQQAAEAGETKFATKPDYEAGFHAEHERFLAEKLGDGSPIFIFNYPRHQKPFYMLPDTENSGKFAACFDLIAPDMCELAGGSLREYQLEPLQQAMEEKGLLHMEQSEANEEESAKAKTKTAKEDHPMGWYLDLRRYGSTPHGGFGLGFDRLLCYIAGVPNVRDMVTFPRYYGRCDA